MRKNCSNDREKLVEAEGRELAKILRSLDRIYSNLERSVHFLKQNTFPTCSWRLLFEFKLEKETIGIYKPTGKVRR